MHESIAKHKEAIAALCREYGVKRLEVFGSAARGYDFDPEHSDVDVVVDYDEIGPGEALRKIFGLWVELEEVFGRRVDLARPIPLKKKFGELETELLYETPVV